VWLLLLAVLGWLQLGDALPLPRVQGLPLPTVLLGAGLLAGALLAVLARPLGGAFARRRARAVRRRLDERIDTVAREEVLAPLQEIRDDHARFCAAVTRAAS
jgi:hypothetical protein